MDFWAPRCGPCRMVVPLVEEIAKERSDVKVVKMNVNEKQELAMGSVEKVGVRASRSNDADLPGI